MEKILDDIYYDRAVVRKTIENVLKLAREKDKSITREDVKAFIEQQEVRQEVTRKRKEGSYVASAAREEFEADLADFGALAVPRYALVCVDVFSRMGAAIPLRSKSAEAMVPALDEVMRQMGTPVRIVTDNGAEFDNVTVVSHLKRLGVELVTIQSFASHVERFIRTLKTQVNVQLRIQKEPLTELLPDLISAYNKEKHSATKMEPLMAARDDEHDVVRGRLNKNLKLVKRPPLEVGDIVKIARPHPTGNSLSHKPI